MIEIDNLEHHCRLCLSNEQDVSLFSDYTYSVQYYKLALALANIQITENDNLPQSICHECSSKLIIFYKFKLKCEASYTTLTSILTSLDLSGAVLQTDFKKEYRNDFTTIQVDDMSSVLNQNQNNPSDEENDKMVLSFFQTSDELTGEGYDIVMCDPLTNFIQEDIKTLPVTVECFEPEQKQPVTMPKLVEFNSPISNDIEADENEPVKPKIKLQCELCGQTFSQKSSLSQHCISHTGLKKFSCDLCHKRFTRKAHLIIHMRIHDNIKPYICEVCSKTFTKSGDLARHLRIHVDEKKYHCTVCKKRFKRSGDVTSHMRSHTGDRPFKCKHCDKAYTSHSSLKKHLKKH